MKTKFKDFLLYSLACVGAVSLFLSAYQPQQITSTVPESHVWSLTEAEGRVFSINAKTGDVRYHVRRSSGSGISNGLKTYEAILTPYGEKDPTDY